MLPASASTASDPRSDRDLDPARPAAGAHGRSRAQVLSALGINNTVAVPPTPPPPPPPPPTPSQSLTPSFAETPPTPAAPAPPARPRIVKPPAKNLAVTSANISDMFSVMYTVDGVEEEEEDDPNE